MLLDNVHRVTGHYIFKTYIVDNITYTYGVEDIV